MKVYSNWDIKNCSIIDKSLNGISEWSAEELQYQQNFPKDIENALVLIKGSTANCIYSHKILLVPSYYSLSLRALLSKQFTQKGLRVMRTLTAPNAVALAKFAGIQYDKTVAIVIVQENYIDLAILTIENGVFEVKFTIGSETGGTDDKIFDVCGSYLKNQGDIEDFHGVDECIIVSENKVANSCINVLEQTFETKSILDTGLTILFKKGMLVQKGILEGTVKDVLLLDMMPYPIYLDADRNGTKRIADISTIPIQKSYIIDIPPSGIVSISEGGFLNRITIERYVFDVASNNENIRLNIDIDTNGVIRTSFTELTAEEGLPEGHADARRNAERGVRHPAYGQDGYGQEVLPETPFSLQY